MLRPIKKNIARNGRTVRCLIAKFFNAMNVKFALKKENLPLE